MSNIETAIRIYSWTNGLTTDNSMFGYEHIPLLRQLIHNGNPIDINHAAYYDYWAMNTFIENILDEAPINGPGYLSDNNHWYCKNRLVKPHGHYSYDDNRRYNGLDYMFLHNLYWLSYYQNTPASHSVTHDFPKQHQYADPFQRNIVGDETTPLSLVATSFIEADNKIEADGDIKYCAPTVILNPGFEVELGAEFYGGPHPLENIIFEKP